MREQCVYWWWAQLLVAPLHLAHAVASRNGRHETRAEVFPVHVRTHVIHLMMCRSPCDTTHDLDVTIGSRLPKWPCVSCSSLRHNMTRHWEAHSKVQTHYPLKRTRSAFSPHCRDRRGTMLGHLPVPLVGALQTRSRTYGT